MNNKEHVKRLRKMLEQVNPGLRVDGLGDKLESLNVAHTQQGESRLSESVRQEANFALESLDVLRTKGNGEIDKEQQFALEAIVMPFYRPVIDIVDDKMQVTQLTTKWNDLGEDEIREKIESCFPSVGRIEATGVQYGGTGFVVGDGLIMTNRHVASIFAQGIGTRSATFQSGCAASIDFFRELGRDTSDSLNVEEVLMIHPHWDMALLKVSGLKKNRPPLPLSVQDPDKLAERAVVVVGYPGFDPYGDEDYQRKQNRIFRGTYSVKRVQPGLLKARETVESYGEKVLAVTHDCSTLGGNSGSAVLLLPDSPNDPIEVVGLHFAGAYLHANYAVPSIELALDNRVAKSGVKFAGKIEPRHDFYGPIWKSVETDETPDRKSSKPEDQENQTSACDQDQAPSPIENSDSSFSLTVPLTVSISLGTNTASAPKNPQPKITFQPQPTEEWLFKTRPNYPNATYDDFDATSLLNAPLDWNAVLSCALASKLVYRDANEVRDVCKQSFEFDNVKFIEAEATECFVAMADKIALVAFRGTLGFEDWLVDFNLLTTRRAYGKVHRGFFGAFDAVRKQLAKRLRSLGNRHLCITGHSLGGAVATIAAAEWRGIYPINAIYTFGQPAVGKRKFVNFFSQNYSRNFFRFVNDDDIVTRVPPGYRHVGQKYHFGSQGNIKAAMESNQFSGSNQILTSQQFDRFRLELLQDRIRRNESGAKTEGLLPSISDHSMFRYIEKIAKMAGL